MATTTLPAAGWSDVDRHGNVTFVKHGATVFDPGPPKRAGYECFFVARHGADYIRWIYKPTTKGASR